MAGVQTGNVDGEQHRPGDETSDESNKGHDLGEAQEQVAVKRVGIENQLVVDGAVVLDPSEQRRLSLGSLLAGRGGC
jgi:hypothetical protein